MEKSQKPFVEIFADGACSGNPGVGGLGVISGLEALKKSCRVRITTDSNYIVKGMTEWMEGWKKRNWQNSQKKEVMNRDLWERLLKAASPHEVEWVWIKGHNGHLENERCDE